MIQLNEETAIKLSKEDLEKFLSGFVAAPNLPQR